MELVCPMCGAWTEIHDHQLSSGNRFKCRRCWERLRIESARPFRVASEREIEKPPVRSGIGTSGKEEQHG